MNDIFRPSLHSQLMQLGQARQGGGAQLLSGARHLWLIGEGAVELFLATLEPDGAAGARYHLCSLTAGQLLAVPAMDAEGGLALLAVPGVQARYTVLPQQALLDMAAEPAWRQDAAQLLDQWCATVARWFRARPRADQWLAADGRYACDAQPQVLAAEMHGLWCRVLQGDAAYPGGWRVPEQALAPVPPAAWLAVAEQGAVQAVATAAICTEGEAWLAGMEQLFRAAYASAVAVRGQEEADELNRLHVKSALGSQIMSDALGGFASFFDSRREPLYHAAGADVILSALQIIGGRMGIAFKAAPAVAAGHGNAVERIAQASGVRHRLVALKGEWWLHDHGPLLIIDEQLQIPLAALPLRDGGYEAVDPRSGERTRVDAERAQALDMFGYMFYAPLPPTALALPDILRFLARGMRRDLLAVAGVGLASGLLALAVPVASGYLFDTVFPAADRSQMLQVVAILFVASLVTLLFEATRSMAMLRIEGRASSDLQAAVWDRVLSLPVPFFRDYSAGDLATRINGINEIRQAVSGPVISALISSTFSLLNVFLLFYYSTRLALAASLMVAVAVLVNLAAGYASLRQRREAAQLQGKVSGMVLEYLNGIAKLRITGAESRAFANWAAMFAAQKRSMLRSGRLANASKVFGAAFPIVANAGIFACIGMAMADMTAQRFSTGDFIAFSAAWGAFLNATLSLVNTGLGLMNLGSVLERTRPILQTVPEFDENKAHPGELSGAIELSHVSFAYAPDAPQVLDDISLSIAPGEFVALVGGSGSGKSTLLRLLLGFERPTRGSVYYDSHALSDVDIRAVRRQLGVVLQSGRVMGGSLYQNIIGATTLTLDHAWEAARACGFDRDIQQMPMGMHTVVADGGGTLSGGQRQRLLIARAIVNKPRILFFDEATSALDNQTQAIVSASMEQLRATRVVIAHRLSTIMNADRIFVLDQGKIVQSGTYQQLIEQPGLFAELARRQMA